jgi:hypothetical protein
METVQVATTMRKIIYLASLGPSRREHPLEVLGSKTKILSPAVEELKKFSSDRDDLSR